MSRSTMPEFQEHRILRDEYNLYAREFSGEGPTFVLLHGFPDNLHIYDQLIPFLVGAGRHVVAFDFLGFGASDRPATYQYSFAQQEEDLRAVVKFFDLERVIPVAHDAGGVSAINYLLSDPARVDQICLLNMFYGHTPALRFPELIELFAQPGLKALSQAMLMDPQQFTWLLAFQNQRFKSGLSPHLQEIHDQFLQPIVAQNFTQKPSAGPAFARMTAQLYPTVSKNTERLAELRATQVPATIIWGRGDGYLTTEVAQNMASTFQNATLHLLEAGHWPQVDLPKEVAELMLGAPGV